MTVAEARQEFGPDHLGRGAFLPLGREVPAGLRPDLEVRIDHALLADPVATRDAALQLYVAWLDRRRTLVELEVDLRELACPTVVTDNLWEVGADFGLWRETVYFTTVVNNYDCRGELPVWHKTERLLEGNGDVRRGIVADVILPDGREAWLDGGPRSVVAGLGEETGRNEEIGFADNPVAVSWESLDTGRLTPQVIPDPECVETLTARLTDEQREAATHPYGPARIIACAGSGKTTTLVSRLRYLTEAAGVEPDLVCAVAFNRLAAVQLRSRLGRVTGPVGEPARMPAQGGLQTRTLHSLAFEIVRDADGESRVADESEVRRILRSCGAEADFERVDDPWAGWVEALTEVRLALRDPREIEAERVHDGLEGFAGVFARYREVLSARHLLDFDEMAFRATELLLGDPGLRARWSRRCRHLVVDEFQDLTPTFVLMLRCLATPTHNVWGCGDDDQVLYEFAGADPVFLVDYARFFPSAASHKLQTNFRCPAPVVAAADRLLSHNHVRVEKKIRAAPGADQGDDTMRILVVRPRAMPRRCRDAVRDWIDQGVDPGDICILARTNVALLAPHALLVRAGVPVTSPLRREVLRRPAIAALLAWLRIATHPEPFPSEDVGRVIQRPTRYLTRQLRDRIGTRTAWSLSQLWDLQRTLEGHAARTVGEFLFDVKEIRQAARRGATTTGLFDLVLDDFGWTEQLDEGDLTGRSRTGADVSSDRDDIEALRAVSELHDDPATFEVWLADTLTSAEGTNTGQGPSGVMLSSVHRAKGREWNRVVVYAADGGLMPHRLCCGDPAEIEAERRVLHVAITRAREELLVLTRKDRHSPFLEEIAPELFVDTRSG